MSIIIAVFSDSLLEPNSLSSLNQIRVNQLKHYLNDPNYEVTA